MIQADHLHKRFGSFTAVADVTFSVGAGEVVALLGPNGAGKTTTVRMLASLLQPTSGRATVAGYDTVRGATQVRQQLGLLTELPGLYNRMSALDYLSFFGSMYPITAAHRAEQTEHLLRHFGVWEHRNRPVGSYSKGMRQKVALARALLHEPAVVLLDEPTSAMDPYSAKTVRDYILGLKSQGRTVLICTHNLAEAEALADRVAIINRGRIVAYGTLPELKRSLLGPPVYEIRLREPIAQHHFSVNTVLSVQSNGPDWVRFQSDEPDQAAAYFVRHLVGAGADVVSVGDVGQSLETVYLRMVEEPRV